VELSAVADPLPERVNEAKEKYGCAGYNSVDELLAHEELEAVTIATPTHRHK